MKRTITFLTALLLAPLAALHAADAPKPDKRPPNVIFILTDDQGWGDAHFAGHPYVKTPNLDKFASQSTWFKQFYVSSPVCSPSRTAFMTSHYPARHGIHYALGDHKGNEKRHLPDWLDTEVPTLTKLMKQAGYATAHFGKWHLGGGYIYDASKGGAVPENPGAPEPGAYGIDAYQTISANGPRLEDLGPRKDPYFWAKSTSLIVDKTLDFIRQNKDQPFYINMWTLLPHARLKPTPEQLKVYENLAPTSDDPAFGPWMQKYLAKAKDLKSQMQTYCASLTDLDTQIGRLLDTLEQMGLAENTIVFLSSDNGAEDYYTMNAANAGVGNTGPLRARKRSLFEGGVRTFGLARWPGHIPAGHVDETSVIAAVDFLPTICNLCKVPVPDTLNSDGEDVSDIWSGKSRPRTRPLYWEWLYEVFPSKKDNEPPKLAVREGDWKLFVQHDGSSAQLYNIPQDESEEHDVAAMHPDLVKTLTGKALSWAGTLPPVPVRPAVTASSGKQDVPQRGTK